eukprot:COSAG02_NODE_8823_length_2431_cov_2.855060_1_plen_144_part_10
MFRDVKLGTRPDGSTFWQELPEYYAAPRPALKLDEQANKQPVSRPAGGPLAEVRKMICLRGLDVQLDAFMSIVQAHCSCRTSTASPHQVGRAKALLPCVAALCYARQDPRCTYRVVNYRELPVSHVGITVNYPMEIGGEDPQGQ